MQLINAGKGEALRIRAILRSLVPTVDLVGIISIPLKMPMVHRGEVSFLGWAWREGRDVDNLTSGDGRQQHKLGMIVVAPW